MPMCTLQELLVVGIVPAVHTGYEDTHVIWLTQAAEASN